MQMKHLLVALVVLLAFAGTAAAADSVDIRSTLIDMTALPAAYGTATLDAYTWAGFYYDMDDDISTEVIYMYYDTANDEVFIKYNTTPKRTAYEYDFGDDGTNDYGYAIIGFFAEPYVALGDKNMTTAAGTFKANKIAKLVIDNDDKYTLKTGATLELGEGYSIVVDQIDVDGNKAYLRFYHDGKELNSSIVSTNGNAIDKQWIFDLTVLNEKNMQVMRVNVKSVFQGTQDSLVEIEGLWLADYLNAVEVNSDTDYGKFEAKSIGTGSLEYEVDGYSINNDDDTELGKGIYLRSGNNFTTTSHIMENMFFLYKSYTDEGTYEIRSEVVNTADVLTTAGKTFDYKNFASFYFDIDSGSQTESLVVQKDGSAGAAANSANITYTTVPASVDYEYVDSATNWTNFYIMGLFGEEYVPFNIVETNGIVNPNNYKQDKIAKLVIDSDDKFTLKTGATLELGEGYTLVVDQIDVDGNKAYIRFLQDGKEVNSSIVTTGSGEDGNWIYRATLLNEKNTQILRVHVKSVFQGTESSLVEIEGLWLMDYVNARELKTDDSFGLLEYKGSGSFKADDVSINNDEEKLIANNMYYKTSEDGTKFYVYVSLDVGNGSVVTPPDNNTTEPDNNTTVPPENNTTTPPENNTTPPVEDDEPGFFKKYMWWIIGIVVLLILIGGAAYYFMVYKKQA